MLHKKANQINIDLQGSESYTVGKMGGNAGEADGVEQIPVKPGRELIEVGRHGAKCYRFEKTRCGKKGCRCAAGELHGPYWYAYYRENGRMRCEYVGKKLPEQASLENRARMACKISEAERERAAQIVAKVKDTLYRVRGPLNNPAIGD